MGICAGLEDFWGGVTRATGVTGDYRGYEGLQGVTGATRVMGVTGDFWAYTAFFCVMLPRIALSVGSL